MSLRSDKEILDWLQNECEGSFSCERLRDPFVDSPTFGDLNEWQVFTIPSQHVMGESIRQAFSIAMDVSAKTTRRKKNDSQDHTS